MTEAAAPVLRPEPGSARLALTLGAAGMISGLVLVGAFEITQPHIEAHRRAAIRRAVFEVVPGATSMRKLTFEGGELREATDADTGPAVYAAYGDEGFAGWALEGQGPGFQDTIRMLWGLSPDGSKVTGMQILESRETPGLGDRIYKDPDFMAEFSDLAVEPEITVVAKGEGDAPYEVDGITGATISAKAVVKIINTGNAEWRSKLPAEPTMGPPEAGGDT